MEWAGSSEDTTAVGAQARAGESVMVRWSGRVKERTPDSKLPSRKYRKSFDDDHGSGTFWTAETSGLGGGGSGGCGCVGHGLGGGGRGGWGGGGGGRGWEQGLAQGEGRGAHGAWAEDAKT